jgi:hypothetical protein
MSIFRILAALPIFLALTAPGGSSTSLSTLQAPQDFVTRITQYVEMRRLVTAPLDTLRICSDPEQLLGQQRAFAKAIREGRPDAREGDIFTPETARYFRALITSVAARAGFDLVVELEEAATWDTEAVVLTVNEQMPWHAGPMMWPSVLERLPELPPELGYRFVGRDLVLVDMLGNVVVDILRESLPMYDESVSG